MEEVEELCVYGRNLYIYICRFLWMGLRVFDIQVCQTELEPTMMGQQATASRRSRGQRQGRMIDVVLSCTLR